MIFMSKKVRKAVIPAAGLGTRVLPASKAMPKEMLPIVDKPAIQYIVEEAVASGITDILIITNRGKGDIENHFDRAPELEERLLAAGRQEAYDQVVGLTKMANICFVRQKETKGLGHAVSCARSFVGDEPFAILFGDDVILGEKPVTAQLCEAYEKYGLGVVGTNEMLPEVVMRGSSLKLEPLEGETNVYKCTDLVEKVGRVEDLLSNYTILGRCVCPPEIFDILDSIPPGAGNEIQLTDALAQLAKTSGLTAVDFVGKRYDMGNKLGILQATVDVALTHPEVSEGFKAYLKEVVGKL